MNDYLTNLTARSFERIDGIQFVSPRLPSLYEPSQKTRDISVGSPSRSRFNNEKYDDGPAVPLSNAGDEPVQAKHNHERKYDASRTPIMNLREGPHLDRPPEEVQTQITEEGQPIRIPGKRRRSVSVQEKQESRPGPLNRSDERMVVGKADLKEQVERVDGRDVSLRARPRERQVVVSPPVIQPFTRSIEPILPLLQNSGHREAPAKPEPTIKVTIGRIDVRAVMQEAPPARRTAPQPPKLSLDEYLKQRNGGRQ
jgi:hypothetical protein